MASDDRTYRLGDLQLEIMKVLWRFGAATVADVHGQLAGERLAYTTVATMLRKMEDRRLVAHEAPSSDGQGRKFVYRPLVSEREVTRGMTGDLVERLFEGSLASTVSHLLEERDVSAEELAELERLIKEHKRGRAKRD
ncbi:MAG: BlaI/MecI/CopY family transcriptional regulator [Pirellulales bacterium]